MNQKNPPDQDRMPDDDFAAEQFAGEENWDDGQPPVDDFADQEATEQTAPQQKPTAAKKTATPSATGKKSNFLLPMIAATIGLVAAGAGGYFAFFNRDHHAPVDTQPVLPVEQAMAPEGMEIVDAAPTGAAGTIFDSPVTPAPVDNALPLPPVVPAATASTETTPAPTQPTQTPIDQMVDLLPPVSTGAPTPTTAEPIPTIPTVPTAPVPTETVAATAPAPAAEITPPVPAVADVVQAPTPAPSPAPAPTIETAPVVPAAPTPTPAAPTVTAAEVKDLQQQLVTLQDELKTLRAQLTQPQAVVTVPPAIEERLAKIETQITDLGKAKPAGIAVEPTPAATPEVPAEKTVAKAAEEKPVVKKVAPKKPTAKKPVTKKTTTKAPSKPAVTKPASPSWVLRGAMPGMAWVSRSASDSELHEVREGDIVSGLGEVRAIRRVDGAWQIEGTKGTLR